jgi:CheY-like chemotaxis protein
MPDTRLRLLVVDDEPSLRTSISLVLREFGYDVRSAGNGFSALSEIRNAAPDILISDLNMPGMSGFELLSVVRRRFPAIPVIAMSGAFAGSTIPKGIPADAFYQKGNGLDHLLKTLRSVSQGAAPTRVETPIWFSQNGHDPSGAPFVTMACPECLRAFPLALCGAISDTNKTDCIHCGISIQYAIASAHCV